MCPNEMVPLQIDLAIEGGRYLFRRLPNPGAPGSRRSMTRKDGRFPVAIGQVGCDDASPGAAGS